MLCFAVPSSLSLASAVTKIYWGSGLGFLLCTYLVTLLFCFSFFQYSPLPSLALQLNKYWREHLMCLCCRMELAPQAAEPLPWLWEVPCRALLWPLCDAPCSASPCWVVHTKSGTHPAAPVFARAVARGWEMLFLVWKWAPLVSILMPGEESVWGNGQWNIITLIWASEPQVPVDVLGWVGMFKAAEISICKKSSHFLPFLTMHLFLFSCSFS